MQASPQSLPLRDWTTLPWYSRVGQTKSLFILQRDEKAWNFRGSTQFPHLSLHERMRSQTGNVVRTCTFGRNKLSPYRCRLARGTFSLLVETLAADGASSLLTTGKMHVSLVCHVYLGLSLQTTTRGWG